MERDTLVMCFMEEERAMGPNVGGPMYHVCHVCSSRLQSLQANGCVFAAISRIHLSVIDL